MVKTRKVKRGGSQYTGYGNIPQQRFVQDPRTGVIIDRATGMLYPHPQMMMTPPHTQPQMMMPPHTQPQLQMIPPPQMMMPPSQPQMVTPPQMMMTAPHTQPQPQPQMVTPPQRAVSPIPTKGLLPVDISVTNSETNRNTKSLVTKQSVKSVKSNKSNKSKRRSSLLTPKTQRKSTFSRDNKNKHFKENVLNIEDIEKFINKVFLDTHRLQTNIEELIGKSVQVKKTKDAYIILVFESKDNKTDNQSNKTKSHDLFHLTFHFTPDQKQHKTLATVGKTKSFLLKNNRYEDKNTSFHIVIGSKYIPIKIDKIFEYKNNIAKTYLKLSYDERSVRSLKQILKPIFELLNTINRENEVIIDNRSLLSNLSNTERSPTPSETTPSPSNIDSKSPPNPDKKKKNDLKQINKFLNYTDDELVEIKEPVMYKKLETLKKFLEKTYFTIEEKENYSKQLDAKVSYYREHIIAGGK